MQMSSKVVTFAAAAALDLEEANDRIHKNCNAWVINLTRDINAQLATS